MKRKINSGYIPFLNILMFMEAIFRKPENIIEEEQQVKDVLKQAMQSLFLIGGVTSTSTTSVNAYYGLIEVVPYYVAIFGTFIISLILLLTIDLSLGIIVPYAADGVCDTGKKGRAKLSSWIILTVGLFFGVTSFVWSFVGMDNVVHNSMGELSSQSTSVADVRHDDDKITDKMLASLDRDIKAAKEEDKRKLAALEAEWELKIKSANRKYQKHLDRSNSWAEGKVEEVQIAAANAIKNFVPKSNELIAEKNEILKKREQNSSKVVAKVSDENEILNGTHSAKKSITSFLLRFIGCGSTVLAVLIAFALALQKSTSPTDNSDYRRHQKKKSRVLGNHVVTDDEEKVTEIDFEVTDGEDEDISIPALIKRIQQNANHYINRSNKMTYYDNLQKDMRLLATKKDREYVSNLVLELYKNYNIAGFDVNSYYE